jgi:hypothetical protein
MKGVVMIEIVANFIPKEQILFSVGIVNEKVKKRSNGHLPGQCCITSFETDFSGIFIFISQIRVAGLYGQESQPKLLPRNVVNLLESGENFEIYDKIKLSFATVPYDLRTLLIDEITSSELSDHWEPPEIDKYTIRLLAKFS